MYIKKLRHIFFDFVIILGIYSAPFILWQFYFRLSPWEFSSLFRITSVIDSIYQIIVPSLIIALVLNKYTHSAVVIALIVMFAMTIVTPLVREYGEFRGLAYFLMPPILIAWYAASIDVGVFARFIQSKLSSRFAEAL